MSLWGAEWDIAEESNKNACAPLPWSTGLSWNELADLPMQSSNSIQELPQPSSAAFSTQLPRNYKAAPAPLRGSEGDTQETVYLLKSDKSQHLANVKNCINWFLRTPTEPQSKWVKVMLTAGFQWEASNCKQGRTSLNTERRNWQQNPTPRENVF